MLRRCGRGAFTLALWAVAGLAATSRPAHATVIGTIGGVDAVSEYNCPLGSTPATCFGTLTFDDGLLGTVTNTDIDPSLIAAAVHLEVELATTRNNNTNPFVPNTTSALRAQFRGTNPGSGSSFRIESNSNVLLAFDVVYIDVSDVDTPFLPVDPDGALTLGAFSEASFGIVGGSKLVLVGGTLNQLVGGLGTYAVLQTQLITLNPTLTSANGYLGQDITAGGTGSGQSVSHWNLSIISTPEPSTAAILGAGLLGLIAVARRRVRSE